MSQTRRPRGKGKRAEQPTVASDAKRCHQEERAMAGEPRPVTIGTHNGKFHCDEALACYMLRLLPEYGHAHIVRTRDPEQLKGCDIVVDVGGEYDPSNHRYDHHQRTFTGSMKSLTGGVKPWVTKLSSAGLVYLHFGRRVVAAITGGDESSSETEDLFDMAYTNFVEEVDAVDNGINDRDGEPRYKVTSTISSRVSRLNPAWNSPSQDTDASFREAMELVGGEFRRCVLQQRTVCLPARSIVETSLENRFKVDSSGEILLLDPPCPWTQHLFELESKLSISPTIKFVIYPEMESTKWRVQAVPIHPGSFQNRVSLLEVWRGLRAEELCDIAGIPGCVFVHANGFIGGNLTKEGALKMALDTLAATARSQL